MAKIKETTEFLNPFNVRKLPNSSFLGLKLIEVSDEKDKKDKEYTGKSFTDKEAYRVTLASARGNLKQILATPIDKKAYSIPAGKTIDDIIDTSYMRRPDLTIADIDDYIHRTEALLKDADNELKVQIESELEQAQQAKEALQQKDTVKDNSDTSSSSSNSN